MDWDERYREAGLKDWADRQRTKRITREFQDTTQEDAYNHSMKMVDHHKSMLDHHEEIADFLSPGEANPHRAIAWAHLLARNAHALVTHLLLNPHVEDETRWIAIEHANSLSEYANNDTDGQRDLLDGNDFY